MELIGNFAFGQAALDRGAELRADAQAVAALWQGQGARVLLLWRGKPLLRNNTALGWLPTSHPLAAQRHKDAVFLARDATAQTAWFAVDMSDWQPDMAPENADVFFDDTQQHHPDLPDDLLFCELRGAMAALSPADAELAATAKSITGWHVSHRFCAKCGHQSAPALAGWERICPSCNAHHYPRTDPVVIMLITSGNSVLLGRSPHWPEKMFSLLAGFVEPGETIETAVRREVFEESGIRVGDVSVVASQPWPYPSSLMIGCRGDALNTDITIDPQELEDALWLSREQVMATLSGESDVIKPARRGAIAHFLLTNWLAGTLE